MKRLDTPYTNKKFKFAFRNIETNEWFLANKKPKDIEVKKGWFGSIFATHYQYTIGLLVDGSSRKKYTEYEFVVGMLRSEKQHLRDARKTLKDNSDAKGHALIRWESNVKRYNESVKFFKKRKLEIENSPEYLWEILKA